MSIIKNKDIYDPSQGDPFAPITKGLDMLDNKIEETKKKMVGLEKTINIGDTSGAQVKELIANIQKLEAEISKLKDTQAAKANIEKQLAYAQEKYNALQTETAAKLAEVKVETQAYNKQLMDNAKLASNTVQAVQKHRIELRELKSTLLTVNKGTKEYNDAMKRAAQITDDLSDMQEKIKGSAMDLEGVMGNVHKVTTGVASGFEIAQGMAALFGSENENLAKALVKVQATMAIAQGLQGLDGMGKAFGRLMLQIRIFAQGVNKALLSTGIGAFLLLIGAIIANWDKVKEAISGVSSETKKLSVEAQKNLEIEQAKTRALEDSENLLRMQGYTEKQILNLKLAQLKTDIEAAEINLQVQTKIKKQQVEAEARNLKILQKGMEPVMFILKVIDETVAKLGKFVGKKWDLGLSTMFGDFTKWSQSFLADPEEVKAEAIAELKEQAATLLKMRDNAAALQLQLIEIENRGNEERTKNAEKWTKKREEIEKEKLRRSKLGAGNISVTGSESGVESITQQLVNEDIAALQLGAAAERKILEEKFKAEQEYQEKRKELIEETTLFAAQQFGALLASGEMSYKNFGKFILSTALDITEKLILLAIAQIYANEVVKSGFLGLAKGAILTALIKGIFAGLKHRVQSFAEGTEFVEGSGTGTSDSIPARLSRGERIVPTRINKQLLGISNNELPNLVNAGLNSLQMEMALNRIDRNTSQANWYLSNMGNHWIENGYRCWKDIKSGIIHKIPMA